MDSAKCALTAVIIGGRSPRGAGGALRRAPGESVHHGCDIHSWIALDGAWIALDDACYHLALFTTRFGPLNLPLGLLKELLEGTEGRLSAVLRRSLVGPP